jgi:hypothetical protein
MRSLPPLEPGKVTRCVQQSPPNRLDGEADTLTRKAIELAKQGDTSAVTEKPIAFVWLDQQSEAELRAQIAERKAKGFERLEGSIFLKRHLSSIF